MGCSTRNSGLSRPVQSEVGRRPASLAGRLVARSGALPAPIVSTAASSQHYPARKVAPIRQEGTSDGVNRDPFDDSGPQVGTGVEQCDGVDPRAACNIKESLPRDFPFALNCDIATPMERGNNSTYGVDLFVDVLLRADTRSYVVSDEAEFEEILDRGLVSRSEERGAGRGLRQLLNLGESGDLLLWLHGRPPFRPHQPPVPPPTERGPIPERLQLRVRRTW